MSLAERLAGLQEVGVFASGVHRMAWSEEDAACRSWFEKQAVGCGLRVAADPAGNLWACPESDPPWWGVGSHLDSVRGGGRFDGPLGVACGFEVASASGLPIAVISFTDEEGARFNTPTFGSKALVGRLDLPAVLERRDPDGVTLCEAMRAAGVDPHGLASAPELLGRLAGFIEVHIDQSTEVVDARVPVGIVTMLASRMRLEVDLRGRADHAGTTPAHQRRDALAAAARLIVAAEDLGTDYEQMTVTRSQILVEPNASTTIAAHVRLWIDARAPEVTSIEGWLGRARSSAAEIASRSRVEIDIAISSHSDSQQFSQEVQDALNAASSSLVGQDVPTVVCFAGHDAGVLAPRIPAAMVLVRNPTGISHTPAEYVELEDAEVAVRVARALSALRDASS